MEFFKSTNIDFLKYKWYFLGFSLLFSVAGLLSLLFWHGLPLGVDFKGGTLVYVKFTDAVNEDQLRATMDKAGLHHARIQRYGAPANNEVVVALEQKETNEQALDRGKTQIIQALETGTQSGKQDLNNVGAPSLKDYLLAKDPLRAGTDADRRYGVAAQAIADFRDKTRGGVLRSIDELRGTVDPAILSTLQQDYFTSNFAVRNVEIVGPQVGKQLRQQAMLATLFSLLGMLAYLWFRFEMIYGVAAVVACLHDTIITIGAFSLTNQEITLTVIAAILTLVGYSMNDTIVVFDRIRENAKLLRRERFDDLVNKSINQTLSRTILTSGLTFLTVLALFVFGGEVLHGFSFALVVGILIGTYSSIAVAAPMLVAYRDWRGERGRPAAVSVDTGRRDRARAKA